MAAPTLSRRRVLAGTAGAFGGTALVGIAARRSDPAYTVAADIDEDGFSVAGAEATREDPPEAITLSVSGGYEYRLDESVDQFRLDLYVEADGVEADMATDLIWDPPLEDSGGYGFDVDLFDHPELDADRVMPDEAGTTETIDMVAAVEASIVDNDEYLETTRAEDDFTVAITADGAYIDVHGLGEVTIA